MKKTSGSIFPYERERNIDLMKVYKELMRQEYYGEDDIRLVRIFSKIAEHPSKRFWVSEERAAIIMAEIDKGNKLERMRETKREMFFEIHRRVSTLRKQHPNMPMIQLTTIVCNQPAPKFYLTPKSVKVIIYKIKRQWYEERKKKLKFMFM